MRSHNLVVATSMDSAGIKTTSPYLIAEGLPESSRLGRRHGINRTSVRLCFFTANTHIVSMCFSFRCSFNL